MQSESIAKLADALAKAQGEITGALKDSANPFFKSKYADLASCWDACRAPLSRHGLAVIQTTDVSDLGVTIITTLAHSSGEWIRGWLRMVPVKADPQGIGSCITYARRYALAGMVGLAQIDDDANTASGKTTELGHTDPRGEEFKKVDTKVLNKYATALNDLFAKEPIDELGLRQLLGELAGDNDMKIAVWSKLQKWQKDYVRNNLKEVA